MTTIETVSTYRYPIAAKINWVKMFYKGSSFTEISKFYSNEFPLIPPPHRTIISRVIKKFEETGSVDNIKPNGRPLSATNMTNTIDILSKITVSPIKSLKKLEAESNISRRSLGRILKENRFRGYVCHLEHQLNECDFDRRMEFCDWAQQKVEDDPMFTRKIIFSDEAIFYLNGHVNRHNMRYYSDTNPYWSLDAKTCTTYQ